MSPRRPILFLALLLAARLWPGAGTIGARVQVDGACRTVVGISADVPQDLMRAAKYEISVPYLQVGSRSMRVLLRVVGDPAPAAAALRQAVRSLDPDLPLGEVQTPYAAKEQFGAPFEFIMGLLCSFAVTALLLAGAGIYGVTSRAVAMRTREIGIRMALGAEPRQVLRYVLRGGIRLALIGTGAGSVLALIIIKLLVSKIWWIEAVPAVVWVGPVALVMAGVALAAALAPARRATSIAPVWALRAE
jgi:putative ABC transport system permease protein